MAATPTTVARPRKPLTIAEAKGPSWGTTTPVEVISSGTTTMGWPSACKAWIR